MKVIGLDERGSYIAIVTHTELEKCAGKYYGKLEKLKIGETHDIGAGYEFNAAISAACKGIQEGHRDFLRASETMTQFAKMIAQHDQQDKVGAA